MKRLVLTLMVAVATLLGVSSLAPSGVAVAQYPPVGLPSISTNVPSVAPGGTFTATASNCLPGETVVFTFQGVTITAVCGATTIQASASFTAPTAPGTYQVCAEYTGEGATVPSGVSRPQTVCTTISVLAAVPSVPATTPGSGLPATGSSGLGTTATSAIVLLSAGVLLLIVSQVRRRRTTTHAAA
jgi:hypothetical protein